MHAIHRKAPTAFLQGIHEIGANQKLERVKMIRFYRAFLEGFIMLQIHNSFGNPISIDESFEISMNVLISGMEQYRRNK